MPSEYLPILLIVAFVIYPFALTGLAAWIASRTGRVRYVRETTLLSTFAGLALAIWFIASNGWGKYAQVTILGSAVFVFCVASTGALLATLANTFMVSKSSRETADQD